MWWLQFGIGYHWCTNRYGCMQNFQQTICVFIHNKKKMMGWWVWVVPKSIKNYLNMICTYSIYTFAYTALWIFIWDQWQFVILHLNKFVRLHLGVTQCWDFQMVLIPKISITIPILIRYLLLSWLIHRDEVAIQKDEIYKYSGQNVYLFDKFYKCKSACWFSELASRLHLEVLMRMILNHSKILFIWWKRNLQSVKIAWKYL